MSSGKNPIAKTEGIVLDVHGFSRTSLLVDFLTPSGLVVLLAKGAMRPKSAFLGQIDRHYTCEALYYVSGSVHILREATALDLREWMRGDWRKTSLADYAASWALRLAPYAGPPAANGPATDIFSFHRRFLDSLQPVDLSRPPGLFQRKRLNYELSLAGVAGFAPERENFIEKGGYFEFCLSTERVLRISPETLGAIESGGAEGDVSGALRFVSALLEWHLE